MVAVEYTPPKPPQGLGPAGADVWHRMTHAFAFHEGELVILAELCRTADLIASMQQTLAETGNLIPGSRGQQVINPLINQIAVARTLQDRLMLSLALPADGEQVGRRRSPQAKQAANSRWKTQQRRGRLPGVGA